MAGTGTAQPRRTGAPWAATTASALYRWVSAMGMAVALVAAISGPIGYLLAGYVHDGVSGREAGVVALIAAGLAVAVYLAFRIMPLAALGRAVRELETANAAVTSVNAELERRNALLQQREEEVRARNLQFDAALSVMAEGLCIFDANLRIVDCNERYRQLFKLPADVARPGASLRECIEHSVRAGRHPGQTVEELLSIREAVFARREPAMLRCRVDGRRIVEIVYRPMAQGGWVATFDDITERDAAEQALAEQNRGFRAALGHMSQGVVLFDGDGRLMMTNDRYIQMYGLSPEIVRPGCTLLDILRHRAEVGTFVGDPEAYSEELRESIARGQAASAIVDLPDGRVVLVLNNPMPGGGWVATHEDVTERKLINSELERQNRLLQQREDELRTQNLRFDEALNNMNQGLCMFDADQTLVVANQRYARMYGLSDDLIRPGTHFRDIIRHRIAQGVYAGDAPEDYIRERLSAVMEGTASTKIQELTDGRCIAISHRPMAGGGWVATHEDITERRQIEARVAHMAHHDCLTGLANRVLLRERMEQMLSAMRPEQSIAVLCLDLDRFKTINDSLGHPVGDELLKQVARRLRGCVRERDVIARLGGDEFAVLQMSEDQPRDSTLLATRICKAIAEPFDLKEHQVVVDASIGIALAPGDGADPDQLLKNADLALYRAKSEGRGTFRYFEPEMDARMKARRELEIDLRRAFAEGQFDLHYQPLVNLESNEISGFEALLRWDHPVRGRVSPAEFIPVAEEIGLIVPLGEWVLRRACDEAATWPEHIKVAVNLSPAQFRNRGLVRTVIGALANSGLSARRLELEITESVLLDDNEATLSRLHKLRDLGVRISMDDFGTGYSSLSYLRSFPFDKIKIDRSFVGDLDNGDDAVAIVRAVASLASKLGMATTAEGVETEGQLRRIRAEGCTEMQGFLFSPPRPAAEIAELFLTPARRVESAA